VKGQPSRQFAALYIAGGAYKSASGRLVFVHPDRAGGGLEGVAGNVALISRADLLLAGSVAGAGAVGLVVFNDEPDNFFASLPTPIAIPAMAVSQAHGEALRQAATSGDVEVDLSTRQYSTSVAHNIVARPPGTEECETVTGGHYDTVQQAPGASDNGTGTATVVEIAGVIAGKGEMDSNCFILFSGEELGLIGSQAFVSKLDAPARQALKAMLNFDMVGVGTDGWLLIGTPALQTRAHTLAAAAGITAVLGSLPPRKGSDHVSFIVVGLPAIMFYRTTDTFLHTPQDVTSRVQPALLQEAATMGVALLEALAKDPG
jgi:Zn-dependent M28 family amino/carboxypeptidase